MTFRVFLVWLFGVFAGALSTGAVIASLVWTKHVRPSPSTSSAPLPARKVAVLYNKEVDSLLAQGCQVSVEPTTVLCVNPQKTIPIVSRCHGIIGIILSEQDLRNELSLLSNLPRLEYLSIGSCNLHRNDYPLLPDLGRLKDLSITSSSLNDEDLKNVPGMKDLIHLNLSYNRDVTEIGMGAFGNATAMETLDLSYTGVRKLDFVEHFVRLKELHLGGTSITDEDLKWVARLPGLKVLGLFGTLVSDEGVSILEGVKSLREVDLRQTKVTLGGLKRLKRALPGAFVDGDLQ